MLVENNKRIGINSRNLNSNVDLSNTINLQVNKKFTKVIELPYHNNNNINHLSVKSKIKDLFSNKESYIKNIFKKDKYCHKKVFSGQFNSDTFKEKKNSQNQNDVCVEESTTNFDENPNKDINQTYSDIKNDQKDIIDINQSIKPIKTVISTKSQNKIRYIKKNKNTNYTSKRNSTEENKIGNLGDKIIKNKFIIEKEDNFPNSRNKNDQVKNFNDLDTGDHDDNQLKDIIRKSITTAMDNLSAEKYKKNNLQEKEKELKKKKNLIALNLKSSKINEMINENKIMTPNQKEISMNNGTLKNISFFKKNEKILQKLKEKKEKSDITKDYIKKEEEKEEKKNDNNKKIIYKIIKNAEVIKNKKEKQRNKNIFNEIIDEVKEEKNYIQKIVHRTLMQSIKSLNESNNINKYKDNNYITKTYKNVNVKSIEKQNTFYKNNPTFSDKKENNNEYFHKHNIHDRNKNSEAFKIFNNNCYSMNDGFTIDSKFKDRKVKIKKIKLGKLKYKLKRNITEFNVNENLMNSKVYTPKKISLSKRKKIELMTIPVNYIKNHEYQNTTSIIPFFNNEKLNNLSYMNNIQPLNEIFITDPYSNDTHNDNHNDNHNKTIVKPSSMFHLRLPHKPKSINNNHNNNNKELNDIKNNIYEFNSSTNNNINENETINHIYSKAKIKQLTDINYNNNTMNRSRTLKNYKKIRNKREKMDKIKQNIITKTQEIQFDGLSKTITDTTDNNNLDKKKQTQTQSYYSIKTPKNKMNINEKTQNISLINSKMKSNLLQFFSHNYREFDNNLSSNKKNNETSKIKNNVNVSCEIRKNNNNSNYIDNLNLNNDNNNDIQFEKILNLLNFEDILIIEDRFNLILVALEKGNNSYEEYFSLWYYYYSSSLKLKFDQIFTYFPRESNSIKIFINYSLIFLMICYDIAVNNIKFDNDKDFDLNTITQLIYTNILIVIYLLKSKIMSNNKDNYYIRLIELSKIEIILKKKLSIFEYDFDLIKEIFHKNSNSIITRIDSIIKSNILTKISKKYNSEIFSKIKDCNFQDINDFFLDHVLKQKFLGCSILARTFLKENPRIIRLDPPYIRVQNKKKYSLVLDLDETLIHFKINPNEIEEGMLRLRPGIFSFLEKVHQYYEIILFTEASEAYANLILEVFKDKKDKKYFDYVLYRQHTIINGQDFIKDLTRIGRPLDKIIIIDNIAQNFKLQKDNGITIKPFFGEDQSDQALIDLIPILINIARDEIDVRNGLMKYRDEIITKISSNLFTRNKQKY